MKTGNGMTGMKPVTVISLEEQCGVQEILGRSLFINFTVIAILGNLPEVMLTL